jgi:acyl carrier protein
MTTANSVNVLELFTQAALEVDNRKLSGLTKDTVISTLGMDSVAVMELVSYFEEKLSVRIPDEDLSRIRTVGDLRDALAKLLPAGTSVTA